MNLSSPIARLRKALRTHGVVGALRILGNRIFPPPVPIHHFDRRYGVDTSGLIHTRKLRAGQPNDPHITAYYGTSPSLFLGVIAQWQQTLASTPYSLQDYILIDIGCGKGRVLMMASDLPFRRILGVEINPTLAAIAHANLARWSASPHACTDITVLAADAVGTMLPPGPTLLYIYNPFDDHVMQLLLDHLATHSRTRAASIDIIYAHPAHASLFQGVPGMSLLWSGDIPIAPEDTAVDAFNGTTQDTNIYRLSGALAPVA